MILSISEFIGHLHPVLVHLPIGILLLACLFLWQSRKDRSENLQKTINIILGLGMVSAIASCITGYILSRSGEYDEQMVSWHQWMGISVAVVSVITFYFRRKKSLIRWQSALASILLVLIFLTGHLGGSLTHGADYLIQPLENGDGQDTIKRKPIAQVQEALVYEDIVEPIFHAKCYSCHSTQKQKGKLRLDLPDFIMKGGKDGVVILAGKPGESVLIKRILLPREEEHHMAPKEKPQLTVSEISLIRWWIEEGASFTKKVKETNQPEKIKPILMGLQRTDQGPDDTDDIPSTPVDKANEEAIRKVKALGGLVLPIAQGSNYLDIAFITATNIRDADLAALLPLQKQILKLKLSGQPVTDSGLAIIAQCKSIIQLQLDHTKVTDKGMEYLKSLEQLRVLNLVGTDVTASGVLRLKDLKKILSIYLYQTRVEKKDWDFLKKNFPKISLDSGGYQVPLFHTDTMIVKQPPRAG